MELSEFRWHVAGRSGLRLTGLHLRRGGADGVLFASVAGMEGEPWVAVAGMHVEDARPTQLRCASEAEAIEWVEEWLAQVLAR